MHSAAKPSHQKTMTCKESLMNEPSSVLAQSGAVMATAVLPVRNSDPHSVKPATANSVPIVTISEGTFVRITRKPLTRPTSSANPIVQATPTAIGSPKWPDTTPMIIEAAGTIAPIEMSSSPAIIRKPIGMAMMPRLAATFSQLATAPIVMKLLPPKAAKKMVTNTIPRMAPASGRLKRLASMWGPCAAAVCLDRGEASRVTLWSNPGWPRRASFDRRVPISERPS